MESEKSLLISHNRVRQFACWVQFIIGIFILAFGVNMMVKADIGMNPWSVFQLGLCNIFHIPFGLSIQIVGFVLIIFSFLIGKIKPRAGTIVNMILGGFFIDNLFYPIIPFVSGLWTQIMLMLIGIIITAIGSALYISADLGAGPRDSLMIAIYFITNKSIGFVRTGLEAIVLLIGFLMGGKVGIGTILFVLLFGAFLQISLKFLKLFPLNVVRVDVLNRKDF